LLLVEIQVFDSQAQALGDPQAAAVEQLGHEQGLAVHGIQQALGFGAAEHNR